MEKHAHIVLDAFWGMSVDFMQIPEKNFARDMTFVSVCQFREPLRKSKKRRRGELFAVPV